MAHLVFLAGTSHGPLLSTPPDEWGQRVTADKQRLQSFRGRSYTFDELVQLRAVEQLGEQCALPVRTERFRQCREAITALRQACTQAAPDVVILIGNDQREIFDTDNQPSLALSQAEAFDNVPYSEVELARLQPGLAVAEPGHHGDKAEQYPGHPGLAAHLLHELIEAGFDLSTVERLPNLAHTYSTGLPHAYGFVYRQIMADHLVPAVPVFINTFYPPNQPTPARCHDLGRALAQAVQRWPADLRVGVIASGGMSHFVVDEELDRQFMAAVAAGDRDALLAIPRDRFASGTSELKNWIPLSGVLAESGAWQMHSTYVPCYRSEAGTGSGMAFASWTR